MRRAEVLDHPRSLLITCEHGGNEIPSQYSALFSSSRARRLLASHRGYDPGALSAATELAEALDAPLLSATVSRLVVDLNRSPHHPRVFSEFTSGLTKAEKDQLFRELYHPYRLQVARAVTEQLQQGGAVLHISVHSFTPSFEGAQRRIDVAWLYDPARDAEKMFAAHWSRSLAQVAPKLRLRRNAPYKGVSDGLTTALRRQFPSQSYAGVELELSQGHSRNPKRLAALMEPLTASLKQAWQSV